MDEIEDESIQLIITSPPYWGLRNYDTESQIGYNDTYKEYLNRLDIVWNECHRVLLNSGSLWINIGKRIVDNNLLLIAADISKRVKKIGFTLKDIIIWYKPIAVPGWGKNNFTDRYEHVLIFTKNSQFLFNDNALDHINDFQEELPSQSPCNIWRIHRKIGNIGKKINIIKQNGYVEHTAVYPDELVRRIILLCSNKNDIILDPFCGSGTTLYTADKMARKWIGYELNSDYVLLAQRQINN